ncbi:NUDIX domain-containing protein [Roseovarius sp. C7]|uniref:NUDIX domain-containing protein n=1 Tax=Roseovarius sp. C7 TaxID=3398643 RepID=UPI0039F6E4FF
MTKITLSGPLEDGGLREIVLGGSSPDDIGDTEIARLDHYAQATGISHEPGRRYGAAGDGGAGALERLAAQEIMAAFGRITPETLLQRRGMILSRAAARLAAAAGVPATQRCDQSADTVELIRSENMHEGFFTFQAMELRHPRFDGGMSDVLRREVFVATDAAILLPYDPLRDRVLLVEQFRMGPYGRGDPRPWMLEPIAGRVDGGESPEATARREAREEAGLELRHIERISSHYCTPGASTEYFHLFLGLCDLPELGHGRGGLDVEHEDIRTHVLDYEVAHGLLASGEADNGPLILSLLWLQRERERLRASA